ncbi:MAG: hypothetical protein K2W85_02460 [Phycisphaerales bacterium]|nr:hypothetical protein [Phycisphaerales bacterium]
MLLSDTGLAPFLAAGVESPAAGSIGLPTSDYVFNRAFSVSINTSGTPAFSLSAGPGEFASVPPITAGAFGKSSLPFVEGGLITASGVAPGTTFGPLGSDGVVRLNDQNVYLFAGTIVENAAIKKAILTIRVDASGNAIEQTLVAKVGGPVGVTGDTWTNLSTTSSSVAINNLGHVIFSGTTAAGLNGVYRTSPAGGGFVVKQGDATPIGSTWNSLIGVPVDMNERGQFAFRGIVGGSGVWQELGDAGESIVNSFSFTANSTLVGGSLREIVGALSSDHDVDGYFITIGDPTLTTQEPFSATTVPDQAAGFPGAAFDTVLYLFRDNFNANGNYRQCVGRSDDAGVGVAQSRLTTLSLPSTHTPGTRYFLVIGTPKTRAATGTPPSTQEQWQPDPSRIIVAGGTVYWIDPSEGSIGRADATTGALLAPLVVSEVPRQTTEGQSVVGDAPVLSDVVGVYDSGPNSKVYFLSRAFGQARIRRVNPDGTGLEDVIASGSPGAFNTTALTVDSVNQKMYWSGASGGTTKIFRSELDGSGRETVLDLGVFQPLNDLAIDTAGSRVYWINSSLGTIGSSTFTGSDVRTVLSGASPTRLAIGAAAQRLYFTSNSTGRVGSIDLSNGNLLPDVAQTSAPSGVTFDGSTSSVLWSNPLERRVRRVSSGGGTAQELFWIGADAREGPGDGPGYLGSTSSFTRFGQAGGASLPYRIRLTGATPANPAAMISRDNAVKVAFAGEPLPDTGSNPVNTIGGPESPVRINDRGAVFWRGRWSAPGTRTGIFVDRRLALVDTLVLGTAADVLGSVPATAGAFDVSDNGRHIVATATNGSFGFSAVNCVLLSFDSAPGCPADFDGDGVGTVNDIFAFLNAWFSGGAGTDTDGSGVVNVNDIFTFLNTWFQGC